MTDKPKLNRDELNVIAANTFTAAELIKVGGLHDGSTDAMDMPVDHEWDYIAPPGVLKPCPFCGCDKLELSKLVDDDEWFVSCTQCAVQQIADHTRERAIDKWNTRIKL